MKRLVLACLLLGLAFVESAPAQAVPYQRPVETAPQPDTIGGGYKTPAVQKPLPRDYWLQVMCCCWLRQCVFQSGWCWRGAAGNGWWR